MISRILYENLGGLTAPDVKRSWTMSETVMCEDPKVED